MTKAAEQNTHQTFRIESCCAKCCATGGLMPDELRLEVAGATFAYKLCALCFQAAIIYRAWPGPRAAAWVEQLVASLWNLADATAPFIESQPT